MDPESELIDQVITSLLKIRNCYVVSGAEYERQVLNLSRVYSPANKAILDHIQTNIDRISEISKEIPTFYQKLNEVVNNLYKITLIDYKILRQVTTYFLRANILFIDIKEKRPREFEDATKIIDEAIFTFEVIMPYINYFTKLALTFSTFHDFEYDVTEKTILNLVENNKELVEKLVKMAAVVKDNFDSLNSID